ncbi:MAG TPA: DotU family type VI secretion system protein [Burkholderiaceae bacterium]|nr:DotU family type VI secretion system protein [Burkholderiaceae bacterium]
MADEPQHTPLPESERTVVRPRPGARAGSAASAAMPSPMPEPTPARAASEPRAGAPLEPLPPVGDNPLLRCAQPLLAVIPQIRNTLEHPDPAGLKESLSIGVRKFEGDAALAGVPRETIIAGRYILCTFLDETAASTPWGGGGVWAKETLLVRFHNEVWGGEKVFMLLSKLAENPGKNKDLLELVYYCLSLGFEGRYRVLDNGRSQLEQLRERLHLMLRGVIPAPEPALSLRWRPAVVRVRRWLSSAPFWAFCALIGVLAVGIYLTYNYLLTSRSDPVFASVQGLRLPNAAPLPPPAPPPPAAAKRLSRFLEQEITDGLVSVRDEAGKSVITIKGDGFFEPGSAIIAPRVSQILERVGQGLVANPGKVLVVGHTDSQPIRSTRYPSNWHLSQDRAQSVVQVLSRTIAPDRLQAEGRADSEPLAPNDTPAGRARNRRVDVTLYVSAGG